MTTPNPLSASLIIIDVSSVKEYRPFSSPFVKLEYEIYLSKDRRTLSLNNQQFSFCIHRDVWTRKNKAWK